MEGAEEDFSAPPPAAEDSPEENAVDQMARPRSNSQMNKRPQDGGGATDKASVLKARRISDDARHAGLALPSTAAAAVDLSTSSKKVQLGGTTTANATTTNPTAGMINKPELSSSPPAQQLDSTLLNAGGGAAAAEMVSKLLATALGGNNASSSALLPASTPGSSTSDDVTKTLKSLGSLLTTLGETTELATKTAEKQSVFGKIAKSLVKIYNTAASYDYDNPWSAPKQGQGSGSGFFITGNRIVTNAHVVSNTTFIQLRKAGTSRKYPAKLRRILHSVDLAILELDADAILSGTTRPSKRSKKNKLAVAEPAASGNEGSTTGGNPDAAAVAALNNSNNASSSEQQDPETAKKVMDEQREKVLQSFFKDTITLKFGETPRVGDEVFAYGFPWGGEEMSLTKGVVSRVEMNETAHGGGSEVLSCDMDTAIVGGNSGGPVIGDNEEVVGVVFQGYDNKPGGYMIAVDVLKRVIALDDEDRNLVTPDVGINVQRLENKSFRRALGLECLDHESKAEEASAKGEAVVGAGVVAEQNVISEVTTKAGILVTVTKHHEISPKSLEGGVMVSKIGEYSPLFGVLEPKDVLLQVGAYPVGENGTIELRKGERTRWTHACYTGKTLGESVYFKWFRDGAIHSATVALTQRPADLRYAVEHLYDVRPRFVLRGGVVFQPFTRNLALKGAWARARIKKLMVDYRTEENPQYVLCTKVLQADLTAGYAHRNLIVERINGLTIHTLEDVIRAFDHFPTGEQEVKGKAGTAPEEHPPKSDAVVSSGVAESANEKEDDTHNDQEALTPRQALKAALEFKAPGVETEKQSSETSKDQNPHVVNAVAGADTDKKPTSTTGQEKEAKDEKPTTVTTVTQSQTEEKKEKTYTIEMEGGVLLVLISSDLMTETKKIAATYHVPLLEHL
ncbi:unnamed protein product [Amoebophrya sp. A120]|nr:unnamed protein product [Amoebophrya sp. A120]|eukprot:GSA120T00011119001.1